MNNDFRKESISNSAGESREKTESSKITVGRKGIFSRLGNFLLDLGLGESILRIGSSLLSLVMVLVVIWLVQFFFDQASSTPLNAGAAPEPTPTASVNIESVPLSASLDYEGIPRIAQPSTIIPSRPRQETVQYTVQEGDTVFGIAEKYGLQPETILWGNYFTLLDDPHNLSPGQEIDILPIDGTLYEWQAGDGLNGVAKFFGVEPEIIINYPGNNLTLETIGDYTNPNIQPGTSLIIPGGHREFVSWSAPIGVTRDNPALARVLGPGACEPISGGAVGYGTFVWPTQKHYLSGFDYSPKSNHWGIDLAGHLGEGIFAVDAGVIVYSGWNNYGYGNMIIVDHGNGWQSLYAHMSETYRYCGQSVGQGEAIGAIGSTGRSSGPHLHFELMSPGYKVNPWDFLPPP